MKKEEQNFDYTLEPGKELVAEPAIYDGSEPLISIITAYYNCKEYIMQTFNSVLNQTFPYWEWVIVNDGSTEEGTEELLNELEKKDSRIKVYHQKNQGRLIARDNAISKTKADIIYMLDSDDLLDKTLLECGYWTMKTNPEAGWAYANCVNFGEMQFLYRPDFDSEQEKKENLSIGSSFIRKQKLIEVGGYNAVDKDVHEDWHLWLRMLEKGYFPVKMNFYGFWYRKRKGSTLQTISKDKNKDKHAKKVIKEQAKKIKHYINPIQYPVTTEPGHYTYPEPFEWDRKPIKNKGSKKHLLFIFPHFVFGGADKFNYDLVSKLDKNKYDITIITTEPTKYIWRSKFEKYADIFDLTTFLHRKNWAGFIHYIIKSRNIDLVMMSNSYYAYYVTPWLKSEFPEVIFTDYIHAHDWSWRNGGYPRDSIAISRFLDKTYTCNNYVKNVMQNEMNGKEQDIETVYIGVDTDDFKPDNVTIENDKIKNLKGKKVILFPCRIVELKRPVFMVKVFKEILAKRDDVVLLVVGDGEQLKDMKEAAKDLGIYEKVIFAGMQNNMKQFYQVADVSVISSLTEGLALTAYEALAMGVPVVTSDVGGQSELVNETCGKVIPLEQSVEKDLFNRKYAKTEIQKYVDAILYILDEKNHKILSENARKRVVEGFSLQNMIHKMDSSFSELIQNGTKVNRELLNNKELYRQYLILYNSIDCREYNINKGGITTERPKSYRRINLEQRLWSHRSYRIIFKFSKKIGLVDFVKRMVN